MRPLFSIIALLLCLTVWWQTPWLSRRNGDITATAAPMLQTANAGAEVGEALAGGQTTIFNTTPNAFGQPAPGLERMDELLFFVGNSFFNQNWVTAPGLDDGTRWPRSAL